METLKVVAWDFLIQVRNPLAGAHHAWPPKRRISVRIGTFPERGLDRIRGWLAAVLLACVLPAAAQDAQVLGWGLDDSGQTHAPAGLTNVVAIAGGGYHSLALTTDGTVVAWGDNGRGQANVPTFLTNVDVVAIVGGDYHSVALKADGTVTAWGRSDVGQINVPAGMTNVVAIAGGSSHSLALKADGTVTAWGYSIYGQTNVPAGLSNVVAIGGGGDHSLALKADGSVVAWGSLKTVPSDLTNVVAIAGGMTHSLALKADGTVVAWGSNDYGQTNVPTGLSNVMAIAGGWAGSVALQADGRVVAWGENTYGQTNVPANLTNVAAIAGGGGHILALAGWGRPFINPLIDRMALASGPVQFRITATGSRPLAFQWQFNGTNIPDATNAVLSLTDVQSNLEGLYSVAVSNAYAVVTSREALLSVETLLITAQPEDLIALVGAKASLTIAAQSWVPVSYQWLKDGEAIPGATNEVYSLGPLSFNQAGGYSVVVSNIYGTLTSRTARLTVSTLSPVVVWGMNDRGQTNVPAGLTNVVAIAGGLSHSLALRDNGTVGAWGSNDYGQTTVPAGLTNVVAIAGGDYHSLALKADGTVVAWGRNNYGQINVLTNLTNVVAIAGGSTYSLALKADGKVVVWGGDTIRLAVPLVLTNAVAIAGGGYNCLALKEDETIITWGKTYYGPTSVPASLTNVLAIAGGGYHGLALNADGRVVAWGQHTYGETNVPANLTNVVAIAGGYGHSLALKADGTVVAWGYNGNGQMTIPSGLTNVVAIAGGGYHCLALGGLRPPFVSVPLANRTANRSSSAQLRVTATGCRPMTFQWRFKGVTIPDATNTVLSLVNVQPGDEGLYSVVASNAYGSVTNDVVILSLLDSSTPPEIPVQSAARLADGRFQFELTAFSNVIIEVQARTNVTAGTWETLRSLTNNSGGTMWFTDPETNHPQRFYRLKQLP